MMTQGYREEDLVCNRAAVLLIGGNDSERRAWAEEVATHFPAEGSLRVVEEASQLSAALAAGRGVVFVSDVVKLGVEGQAQVLRCLQYQEERPKIVVALGMDATAARSQGKLREDLHYRLHLSIVNLSTPGLRDVMRARRATAEAIRKEAAAKMAEAAKKSLEKNRTTVHAAKKKPAAKAAVSGSRSAAKPEAGSSRVSAKPAASGSRPAATASRAREATKPAKRETRPAAKLTRPVEKAAASNAKSTSKTAKKAGASAKKSASKRK